MPRPIAGSSELELVTSVYRATNAIVRELDRRLGNTHNITFIQAVTLLAISSFEHPQPHLVAEHLSQQSQTVTGVLDRLERAGHVRRFRDMNDRRAVRLELTDSGEDLVRAVAEELTTHLSALLAEVGQGARKQIIGGLEELETSVRDASEPH